MTDFSQAFSNAFSSDKGNFLISINISLNFVPNGRINNIPALVQIMVWRYIYVPSTKNMHISIECPFHMVFHWFSSFLASWLLSIFTASIMPIRWNSRVIMMPTLLSLNTVAARVACMLSTSCVITDCYSLLFFNSSLGLAGWKPLLPLVLLHSASGCFSFPSLFVLLCISLLQTVCGIWAPRGWLHLA